MAYLTIYTDDAQPRETLATSDEGEIRETLAARGVTYTRWPTADELAGDAQADAVLAAYAEPISRLSSDEGYVLVDVAALHPSDDPEWASMAATARHKFLAEHTHADDEVRFFAGGSGIFYLHIGDAVYAVLGERGDLLSVPKGTTHWFDMGTRPDFTAVRFFRDEEGWVGEFTGDPIAERIPDFDTIVAARRAGSLTDPT
jgi:1,2-dihydroxy-3-keto-5-methylthiopentene dioxygenase